MNQTDLTESGIPNEYPDRTIMPNGSWLKRGGTTSGGRPASAVRRRCGETLDALMDRINQLVADGKLNNRDLISTAALMAKYALVAAKNVTIDKGEYLQALSDVLAEHVLDGEQAMSIYDAVVSRLKDVD